MDDPIHFMLLPMSMYVEKIGCTEFSKRRIFTPIVKRLDHEMKIRCWLAGETPCFHSSMIELELGGLPKQFTKLIQTR